MTRKMTLKIECGGIALLAMAGTVLMCEAGSLSDYLADVRGGFVTSSTGALQVPHKGLMVIVK